MTVIVTSDGWDAIHECGMIVLRTTPLPHNTAVGDIIDVRRGPKWSYVQYSCVARIVDVAPDSGSEDVWLRLAIINTLCSVCQGRFCDGDRCVMSPGRTVVHAACMEESI